MHQQLVANEGLLESRAHEGVTRTRVNKNGKVNVEEREVDDERNHNQTNSTSQEVFPEVFLTTQVNICYVYK